jgi:hypothetical protein
MLQSRRGPQNSPGGRAGPEGSLTDICMLDDDIALFMHAFPDANDRELRAQCLSALLEYEESMQAWEEARNSGELDSDSTDSGDEGELTGNELLRDLEEPTTNILPGAAPVTRPSHIEWPKGVLRQTVLVSSIAAEIESNIDQTDWDADCYEECQRLLQREAKRMEAISEDRGAEEIPVLVDLEAQHWIAEALEGAGRASELIGDRIAPAGVCCPSRGEEESQMEASGLSPAAVRAAQAVMRAATTDPLSDSQLERVVRLALGKKVPAASTTNKAAVAHVAAATTSGGDSSRALAPTMGLIEDHQAERRVESEDEGESRTWDPTRSEGSPPAVRRARPASPGPLGVAAQSSSEASVAQPTCANPPTELTAVAQGRKKKNRAAKRAARAAWEAGNGSPTTGHGGGAGGQTPPVAGPPRGKKRCPVFGCTRKHAPNDYPTFLDMMPKERLDLVHAKQLCLLYLRNPTSVGCEVAGKGSNYSTEGCNRPHHVTLHGILKAGKSSPPVRGTDPPDGPTEAAANRTPDLVKQLRGLLEGLGIDPDALEVRIGIRKPGEQGRPHGGGAVNPGATEAGKGRLTSKLLEALTLLCQAGERFVDSAGESRRRMIKTWDPTAAPEENNRGERGRSATGGVEHASRRDGSRATRQESVVRDEEDNADEDGERRWVLESSEYAHGNQGSLERCRGLQRVVVLTPDGGQLINMGIGRGFVFSVVSQRAAARYAVDRSKLQTPIMLDGPSNQQVRATELCTIAFPQEKDVGGKMVIYAYVVDTLEECYETPGDGLQRWQMQLGEEDEGYLRWLRVAQPGDRPHYELTLESVTLSPERVSQSTWKFLVCKGRQMTETVWLTAARAWNMPVSRISADAATRLGLTEWPNDWCQVRPCNAAGRQEDGFLAKIASVLEIAPPGYPTTRRPRELNFRKPDVVIGTRDWEAVERFLCNVEPDKNAGLRETRKHHIRIVLQGGERWYLNLLVSGTARRSRITSMAAAKLGRGSVHDKRMHLRDVNGREVSITVDVVDTMRELLEGEDSHPGVPKPHMVLTPGDERRIQGMMLTGWIGKADLLRGWASQGGKKGQPTQEASEEDQGSRCTSNTSR